MSASGQQELSKEIRSQKFACVFCDSVRRRLRDGDIPKELELLYAEHVRQYHGMTV